MINRFFNRFSTRSFVILTINFAVAYIGITDITYRDRFFGYAGAIATGYFGLSVPRRENNE